MTEETKKNTFQRMKENLIRRLEIGTSRETSESVWKSATRASFKIAEELAKHGKPFSDAEIVKKCILLASEEVCPSDKTKFDEISLSRNTTAERTEEIGQNLLNQLKDRCKTFKKFSISLDESTDQTDTAELAVFIRGVDSGLNVTEEFLDIVPLSGTTTSEDVFEAVEEIFEKFELPWDRLSSVSTDGAPAMTGRKSGFYGRLFAKLQSLGLLAVPLIHCMIHREQLCSQKIKMDHVMKIVVEVINVIRARGLNHRDFRQFLDDISSSVDDILYFTKVRWLSCGNVLKRVRLLKEQIKLFLEMKGIIVPEFNDEKWWQDLCFLADLCDHLNVLNLKLQGSNKTVVELKESITAFERKFSLFISHIKNGVFQCFPFLQEHINDGKSKPEENDIKSYLDILEIVSHEFQTRFEDLDRFDDNIQVFSMPFVVKPEDFSGTLALELIDLQSSSKFQELNRRLTREEFWREVAKEESFPELVDNAITVMSLFGTTYRCEQSFSMMKVTKSVRRSRISNEHLNACLRIMANKSFQVDFDALVENKRCQCSKSTSNK